MYNMTWSEGESNLTEGKPEEEDFLLQATYFLMFQIGKSVLFHAWSMLCSSMSGDHFVKVSAMMDHSRKVEMNVEGDNIVEKARNETILIPERRSTATLEVQ